MNESPLISTVAWREYVPLLFQINSKREGNEISPSRSGFLCFRFYVYVKHFNNLIISTQETLLRKTFFIIYYMQILEKKKKICKRPLFRPPVGMSNMFLNTTLGQFQRWADVSGMLCIINAWENDLNRTNKALNGRVF